MRSASQAVVVGGLAVFQIVEIPVDEFEIGVFVEEVPVHDAARIDEVDFDVRRAGDFVEVEAGRRKAVERFEGAALQQFGQRPFEGDFEARMGAEAGEDALVVRVEHGHAHHRVVAAERGVLDQDAEAGVAQALACRRRWPGSGR